MENVLVTGAAGFIGLNMIKYLNSTDSCIYALVLKGDHDGIIKLKQLDKDINIIEDTIDEMIDHIDLYPRFDKIFHFASVGVDPEYDDIENIIDTNIKMGCLLINFASINKSGLIINVGSCFEYGKNDMQVLKESDACYPESLYAVSKNASVNLMNIYAKKRDINLITVRPFGVFGSGEGENRLAPLIIKAGLTHRYLEMTGGEQVRYFVDVKDVVRCIFLLSHSTKIKNYEIYNICSNNPVTVKEFAEEIISCLGFDRNLYKFGSIPYRINEAMYFVGNNEKLLKTIDYKFPDNHKKGILDLYDEIKIRIGEKCKNKICY